MKILEARFPMCKKTSAYLIFFFTILRDLKVSNQPWGLQEPSGESCVAADSALQWRWNSMRCVISAHVVCEAMIARCPSPEVKAGAYIALGAASEGHHYNVGQVIEYACQEGYAPTLAKLKSRCLKNGTWSGGTPDCTFHDCKDDIFLGMLFFHFSWYQCALVP